MRRSAAKVIELFQTTIDCQHHDNDDHFGMMVLMAMMRLMIDAYIYLSRGASSSRLIDGNSLV